MPTNRTFYKTLIQVEVLSEEPYNYENLQELAYDITFGHCSGVTKVTSTETLNGEQAASALRKQGSDPEFFMLDENGNDLDEDLLLGE